MSANVETMVYVKESDRDVPWHGLGTPVPNAMTSGEAIELAGLNWNVVARPIFDTMGNEIEGYKANTRTSDDSVLGIVSDKYSIVQNIDAFEFTDNLIGGDVRYDTAGSLRNGKKVWLLAKVPQIDILGDKIDPYICFTNTHDGSGAVKVAVTPVRVVCENTLNFALSSASRSWSTKHMGDMKVKIQEARKTLELTNLYLYFLNKAANDLYSVHIDANTLDKLYDQLFPLNKDDSPRKYTTNLAMREEFNRCYNMPDLNNFRNTGWGFLMAATDFADHSRPARLTKDYQANNWDKIIGGHSFVDKTYALVKTL